MLITISTPVLVWAAWSMMTAGTIVVAKKLVSRRRRIRSEKARMDRILREQAAEQKRLAYHRQRKEEKLDRDRRLEQAQLEHAKHIATRRQVGMKAADNLRSKCPFDWLHLFNVVYELAFNEHPLQSKCKENLIAASIFRNLSMRVGVKSNVLPDEIIAWFGDMAKERRDNVVSSLLMHSELIKQAEVIK